MRQAYGCWPPSLATMHGTRQPDLCTAFRFFPSQRSPPPCGCLGFRNEITPVRIYDKHQIVMSVRQGLTEKRVV